METQDVWLYKALGQCEATVADIIVDLHMVLERIGSLKARLEKVNPTVKEQDSGRD